MNIETMITNSHAPDLDCRRLCNNTNNEVSTSPGKKNINSGMSNLNPLNNLTKG